MHTDSDTAIIRPHITACLLLAVLLVCAGFASVFHHHDGEQPASIHADCVLCLHSYNTGSALVPAFSIAIQALQQPLPDVLVTVVGHNPITVGFSARAPPSFS